MVCFGINLTSFLHILDLPPNLAKNGIIFNQNIKENGGRFNHYSWNSVNCAVRG